MTCLAKAMFFYYFLLPYPKNLGALSKGFTLQSYCGYEIETITVILFDREGSGFL